MAVKRNRFILALMIPYHMFTLLDKKIDQNYLMKGAIFSIQVSTEIFARSLSPEQKIKVRNRKISFCIFSSASLPSDFHRTMLSANREHLTFQFF
mmetsp:Transcript_28291/g.58849  ORF Transcript_28291/g.58849 Transcript_28291/m.58849 type:complete len:95 (-) Transcript_28291:1145-1429(-)